MAIYSDETQPQEHLERPSRQLGPEQPDADAQRKRMLIALGILLMALAAVIVRDWDFWFPSRPDSPEVVAARKAKMLEEQTEAQAPSSHPRPAAKPAVPAEQLASDAPPMAATTQRTVLPPLQVEVVAGNQRVSVPGKNPAIHVDVGEGGTTPTGRGGNDMVSAADRVSIPPQIQQRLSVSVPPDYPLLARQMKVQGAVSLQALIARDGTIQELQILSGPEILATAAREAVKQWHFKPYLQNGQPVETQAKITVNFTISTN
ncbi:MAG: TonB family protein [Terriglobales bacterium]